jgi:hypothetical protein
VATDPGAVCRFVDQAACSYLETLLYEQVNDPDIHLLNPILCR